MAYVKNIWVDQDVERPKTYDVTNNQDGSITLVDSFGIVTELGTPVNATNMNHIENGIAGNDTAISTINSKIPSNASSSNKLVSNSDLNNKILPTQTGQSGKYLMTDGTTASWQALSGLDEANKDLSNLSTAGNDKLRALRGYLENGNSIADVDGLSYVKQYAHSSFDLSKFSVVGSPIITSDGIVSGFTNSHYLDLPYNAQNLLNKSWTVTGAFIYKEPEEQQNNTLFNFTHNYRAYGAITLRYASNAWRLTFTGTFGTEEEHSAQIQAINFSDLTEGNLYIWKLSFDYTSGQYTMTVYNSNFQSIYSGNYTPTTTDKQLYCLNLLTGSTYSYIGRTRDANQYSMVPIDLKYQSIRVDGVEVFTGNKTGLDIIKPDNYTISGTPTITNDGFATNIDGTNGLVLLTNYDISNKEVRLEFEYIAGEFISTSGNESLLCIKNVNDNARIATFRSSASNNTNTIWYDLTGELTRHQTGNCKPSKGDVIKYVWTIGSETINAEVYQNGSLVETDYQDTSAVGLSVINLSLGLTYSGMTTSQTDLCSIKMYVNGDLVYQPCLKIPYTESKTGSKIADVVYRNRVKDVYEQYGYAPYYTLSDTDFTLPMGEVYGMMLNQSTPHIVETYINGTSWYRVWSDGWCEQGGIVDRGSYDDSGSQNVALLKNYINGNYAVLCSMKDGNANDDYLVNGSVNPSKYTTSGFTIYFYGENGGSDAQRYLVWEAKGYIEA